MPKIVGIHIPTTVGTLAGGQTTTSALTLKSTTGVGTTGADIIFQVGNNGATEAMRILNGGTIGIGTASPTATLDVLKLSGDAIQIKTANSNPSRLGFGNNGSVWYLTTTTWATGSDERLKENIVLADLDICYNTIKNLPLKRFSWKASIPEYTNVDDRNAIGWIAQDVQAVFPNAVKSSDEMGLANCLSLQPDQIYKAMYGALQKLMTDFEDYKATHP